MTKQLLTEMLDQLTKVFADYGIHSASIVLWTEDNHALSVVVTMSGGTASPIIEVIGKLSRGILDELHQSLGKEPLN